MINDSENRRRYFLVVAAVLVLLLGVFVYVLDRNPQQIYFLSGLLDHSLSTHSVFGMLGSSLPSFVHVYAFILFTAVLLAPTRNACFGASLFWLITDSAFEIAQHSAIAPVVAAIVPDWFSIVPIVDNTRAYFLNSTYDTFDLAAIVLGALTAMVTLRITIKNNSPQSHQGETSIAAL